MEEGDTMRETRVGEFEGGRTVMETVVRGIESEAEIGEIGREAIEKNIEREVIVESIERETKARGVVIDTVAGSIEREMDVVDIEEGNKRLKKASKLVSSPYTTGAKWRRHVDSTRVDPFRDVDPVKRKQFSKWHSNLGDG
ncbi:Hypothetical predicted protein [Olea europaea subsp. europaea]|uniref:Uncharacterized protein n=1 Tax=Olea europaea subsp. europaea TaxID=158383 RepID=A0A8S0V6E5_OLEEU|nr:Hypothetical predicted protein [Olea europaea subsp. europaea]